jgi:hypothetical protein
LDYRRQLACNLAFQEYAASFGAVSQFCASHPRPASR